MSRLKKRLSFVLWMLAPLVILPFLGVWYERHTRATFLQDDDFYQLDALAGHVHAPDAERTVEWPEHPDGGFAMRTNNLGLREDEATPETSSKLRFMVVGDSHTDGVCNNNESFANVAERLVNQQLGDGPLEVEVLNGGTGFYSFQHYAGFFEKHQHLASDWTVVIYLGNDFIETVLYDSTATDVGPALKTSWYRVRKKLLNAGTNIASTQSVNQLLYFNLYPEQRHRALELAKTNLSRIIQGCHENDLGLRFLLLPPATDVDDFERLEVARATGWEAHQLDGNKAFGDSLSHWLRQQNVAVGRLDSVLIGSPDPMYWSTDKHLSSYGHAAVGKELARWLLPSSAYVARASTPSWPE